MNVSHSTSSLIDHMKVPRNLSGVLPPIGSKSRNSLPKLVTETAPENPYKDTISLQRNSSSKAFGTGSCRQFKTIQVKEITDDDRKNLILKKAPSHKLFYNNNRNAIFPWANVSKRKSYLDEAA